MIRGTTQAAARPRREARFDMTSRALAVERRGGMLLLALLVAWAAGGRFPPPRPAAPGPAPAPPPARAPGPRLAGGGGGLVAARRPASASRRGRFRLRRSRGAALAGPAGRRPLRYERA